MPRLLIIPSWYPRPDDRINGSFFQEQARLVSDQFDVKVLLVRYKSRPSTRAFVRKPVSTLFDWMHFVFYRTVRISLPDDVVFTQPPLIEYRSRALGVTQKIRYYKRIQRYLDHFDELIAAGWKPDLIHAHSVDLGGLVANAIKIKYGIPYLITEHMPFAISNYPSYMRDDIKHAFRNAGKVLSLSYDKVRQLCMSGIDVEPNLVFNLVDESVFNETCAPYISGQGLKLISIGAASHLKDHVTLLRALLELKKRNVPFKLTLIGLRVWGNLYEETIKFIELNGLSECVDVIDRSDRGDVPKYLVSNNVFLMTSIAEGFPVSVIEAMASGLFVIATRHGGTEDIMTTAVGRIVEIKNYQKIADYLEEIYLGKISFDPSFIRGYVISVCGTQAFKSRLLRFYSDALGGP